MSIKHDLTLTKLNFISFKELIETLAASEGISKTDVVGWLLNSDSTMKAPDTYNCFEKNDVLHFYKEKGFGDYLHFVDVSHLADDFGFIRPEIIQYLHLMGIEYPQGNEEIPLPNYLNSASSPQKNKNGQAMRWKATSATAARYWEKTSISGKEMALLCAGFDPEGYLNHSGGCDGDFYSRRDHFYQLEKLFEDKHPRHCKEWLFFLYGIEIAEPIKQYFHAKLAQENETAEPSFDQSSKESIGRRELQLEIILVIIAALNFEPLQIPDGGKAKIRKTCLLRPKLFTEASFGHAWKAGVAAGLFRLKNHDKYSPA